MCNRLVRFLCRHDRKAIFSFASLQSPVAARILARNGTNAANLATFCVVINSGEPAESLLLRSEASLYVLEQLGGVSRAAALVLRLVPRPIREWVYDIVAHNRYRIFGRYDSCPLPDEHTRSRFIDI